MKKPVKLYRVELPYAVFGVLVKEGIVVTTAPIGKWMKGKNIEMVRRWVTQKNGLLIGD